MYTAAPVKIDSEGCGDVGGDIDNSIIICTHRIPAYRVGQAYDAAACDRESAGTFDLYRIAVGDIELQIITVHIDEHIDPADDRQLCCACDVARHIEHVVARHTHQVAETHAAGYRIRRRITYGYR
jgi:hypothetical protein